MPDECQKCGDDLESSVTWKDGPSVTYLCGTQVSPNGIIQGAICKDRQLTALQSALRDTVKVVGKSAALTERITNINWRQNSDKYCEICGIVKGHTSNCIVVVAEEICKEAAALLPRLEGLVGEG